MIRFTRIRRSCVAAVAAAAFLPLLGVTAHAAPASDPATASPVSWQANLADPGAQQVNLTHTGNGVRVRDPHTHPAATGGNRGYASDLLPSTNLDAPVGTVTATVTGRTPSGSRVEVDVRGLAANGRWSEWLPASVAGGARLTTNVTTVQARITLWTNGTGQSPTVHAVSFTGTPAAQAAPGRTAPNAVTPNTVTPNTITPDAAPVNSQVYATREGLVGGTTANGHVIQSNDHFVALPSGTALSPNGSNEYEVQVCGSAGCEIAPVWDIGPWNTQDNYWDPSTIRQEFQDLTQGLPEAQAAYQNGYHGGTDETGRTVLNPAGIDLADGTYADVVGSGSEWVTVSYLWSSANIQSSPVVQYGQQAQVFGRDSAGAAYSDVYTSGSGWSGWQSLGGNLADDPTAIQYGTQMQVYGRDSAGATYSDVYTPGSGWSGWKSIGGNLAGDPTAIEYGTQLQVYGRAANGATYSDVYTPGSGWSGWQNLGGNLAGNLSLAVYGTQMQVFGRAADGSTWSDVYTQGKGWSGWQSLGGNLASDPVAITYGSQMQVYGRAANGATYSDVYTPGSGWSGWKSIGGNLAGSLSVLQYGTQLQVYGRDSAGATYSDVYTPGSGWSGWQSLGGNLANDPVAIAYGSQLEVYGRAANGATYSDVYTQGKGWSGWSDLNGNLLP